MLPSSPVLSPLLLLLLLLCSASVAHAVDSTTVTRQLRNARDVAASWQFRQVARQTLSLDGDEVLQLVRTYEAAQQQQQQQQQQQRPSRPSPPSSQQRASGDDDDDDDGGTSGRAALHDVPLVIINDTDKKGTRRAVLLRHPGVVIALTADHPAHRNADDHVGDGGGGSRSSSSSSHSHSGRCMASAECAAPTMSHVMSELSHGVPAALGNYASGGDGDARGTLLTVTLTLLCLLVSVQLIL